MTSFFKKLYTLIILLMVCMGLGMFFQYTHFNAMIQKEVEANINLKLELMSNQLENQFEENVQVIQSIESFIKTNAGDEKLLAYLKSQLEIAPSYMSLYFGTPENEMVNGSGWVPPEDFDLRVRPWYISAVEEQKLISTSLYLNASKDTWIVTYAMPIYDADNRLLGVIGGDNSVQDMIQMLKNQKVSANGDSFFLDANGQLIMHSKFEDTEKGHSDFVDISNALNHHFSDADKGIELTTLNGVKGYLGWNRIDSTGWVVGNFAPASDFSGSREAMEKLSAWILMILLIVLVLLFQLQKQTIVRPLSMLISDIERISVNDAIGYRLPINPRDPFLRIRETFNKILDQTQLYFEQLTESKKALEKSKNRNAAFINVLPDLIFVYDRKGHFKELLTQENDDLLMDKEAFLGKHLSDVMPEGITAQAMDCLEKTFATDAVQHFEYSLEVADDLQHFETRMVKANDEEALAIVRNITERKINMMRVETLSYFDQLTNLHNRRYFEEAFERVSSAEHLPLALVIFDVNGLKLTNDAFGHLIGDEVLIKTAEMMKLHCRADDITARIGGDEFVMLLPNTTAQDVEGIIERIYNHASEVIINNVPLSVSVGWAVKSIIDESNTDLFKRAEDAMYRRKLTESQSMRNQTIKAIINTLNEKNHREKVHSDKVSSISQQIGKAMGFGYEQLKELEIGGLLHDVGKIAIHEEILNKPDVLTEIEYIEVQKHSEIGYQILKSVDAYSVLAEYVLCHHERWDGRGYPRGIKGEQIPLVARIITVADAYEAMISDRPYRKALSHQMALDELEKNAGTQFDPTVVEVFLSEISESHFSVG